MEIWMLWDALFIVTLLLTGRYFINRIVQIVRYEKDLRLLTQGHGNPEYNEKQWAAYDRWHTET